MRWSFQAVLLLVALALAPAAMGQDHLDEGKFIDGLGRWGMSDLLLHLLETDPPDDPLLVRQIQIAQYRAQFIDPTRPLDERIAAIKEAIAAKQSLIDENPDHPERAIWQTDLAEMLLFDYIIALKNNAADFYEFGVPSPDQAEAFESAAAQAVQLTGAAAQSLFRLPTLLRDEEVSRKLQTSGLLFRLTEEYEQQRVPFYRGKAAYYASLLPDSHPYFAEDGRQNPDQPSKLGDPAAEKKRLRELAAVLLEPFATDAADEANLRVPAALIRARAMMALGKTGDDVESQLRLGTQSDKADVQLTAELALARLAELRGNPDAAEDRLAELEARPSVLGEPLNRVLVADAEHRTALRRLEKDGELTASDLSLAYAPYSRLLNSVESDSSLRDYIFFRWASSVSDDQDPTKLPELVRLAVGMAAAAEGGNLVQDAASTGDEALAEQGRAALDRAVKFLETLTDSKDEAVRAEGMYSLALAIFFRDMESEENLQSVLRVADLLTTLADELPRQPKANEAITTAIALLHNLHLQEPRPAGIDKAYRAAAEVLFSPNYARSETADNERLYYGYWVLQANGEYERAAEIYAGLQIEHPDYFDARREMLFSMFEALKAKPQGAERDAYRGQLVEEAKRLLTDAEAARQQGDAREDAALAAEATSTLIQAKVQILQGNNEVALAMLDGFADKYGADIPTMQAILADALATRVELLSEAGNLRGAEQQVTDMMQRFPDEAANMIMQILDRLDVEIESLRQQALAPDMASTTRMALRSKAQEKAQTASSLARLLLKWAAGQDLSDEELLPYQLVELKASSISGKTDESVALAEKLLRKYPTVGQVVSATAEAYFNAGRSLLERGQKDKAKELMVLASRGIEDEAGTDRIGGFDKLIVSFQQQQLNEYPPLFWNAWMRRLQINDLLGFDLQNIPLKVRQLRQFTDPTLGGSPYREALEALETKHAAELSR